MKFFFDKEGDILDIFLGKPEEAISKEIGDDIIIRMSSENEIVGVTVLDFGKSNKEDLPLYAKFSLIQS